MKTQSKIYYKENTSPYTTIASLFSIEEKKGKFKWTNLPMAKVFNVEDIILKEGEKCFIGKEKTNSDGSIILIVYWDSKKDKVKYATHLIYDSISEAIHDGWDFI